MQSIVIAELKYQKILNKFINSTVTNILDIVSTMGSTCIPTARYWYSTLQCTPYTCYV